MHLLNGWDSRLSRVKTPVPPPPATLSVPRSVDYDADRTTCVTTG